MRECSGEREFIVEKEREKRFEARGEVADSGRTNVDVSVGGRVVG